MGVGLKHIQLMRRQLGDTDRKGNPVVTYSDPEPLMVLGVAPRNRDEPVETGREEAVSTVWDVYAPLGVRVAPYDRVLLPRVGMCEVVGDVGVWDHNPHSTVPLHGGVQFTVQSKRG